MPPTASSSASAASAEQFIGFADAEEDTGVTGFQPSFDVQNGLRKCYFSGSTTLDNGIKIGVRYELGSRRQRRYRRQRRWFGDRRSLDRRLGQLRLPSPRPG